MNRILTAMLIAFSTLATAEEAKIDRTTYTQVPLELKGVRLGLSYDEAASVFPDAKCHHSERLRGFSFCINPKSQFADEKARLEATFIDGVLVNIKYDNISMNKYQLVLDSLAAKYGAYNQDGKKSIYSSYTKNGSNSTIFWRNTAQDTLHFSFPTKNEPAFFSIELIIENAKYNELYNDRNPDKPKQTPKTDDI